MKDPIEAKGQSLPSFGDHTIVDGLLNNMNDELFNKTNSGNESASFNPRGRKTEEEFYYHTDVQIDFQKNVWYWNSTKDEVKQEYWDNIDYFQTNFPYMQDAVALNIYSDKVLYRIFVSLKIRIIYFQNMV